jgi:hypothetical protein
MDYSQDLFCSCLFQYTKFLGSTNLSDCTIQVYQHQTDTTPSYELPGHKLVIANSSEFFYNSFTSGMEESATGVVRVFANPPSLFRTILEWMYTGILSYDESLILHMIQICHDCGIAQLEHFLVNQLPNIIRPDNICHFLRGCFDDALPDALPTIVPLLAQCIGDIDAAELSSVCDVATFTAAVKQSNLTGAQRLEEVAAFFDDPEYEVTPDDRQRLLELLKSVPPADVRDVVNLREKKWQWVNPNWYKSYIAAAARK